MAARHTPPLRLVRNADGSLEAFPISPTTSQSGPPVRHVTLPAAARDAFAELEAEIGQMRRTFSASFTTPDRAAEIPDACLRIVAQAMAVWRGVR